MLVHIAAVVFLVLKGFVLVEARTFNPTENSIPEYDATVVYKWVTINYKKPENMTFHNFRMTYPYDYRNIVLSGIKVFNGEIYVTVPRISPGVPATLARVIEKDGVALLDAFPNWDWQEIGNCEYIQTANNIEVDPEKGWMWIVDSGRINTFWGGLRNLCQPKLIIYDLTKNEVVLKYDFPDNVVSKTRSYLYDIAIDPDNGYAFIPDTVLGKLIFFSLKHNYSTSLDHPLFKFEKGNNTITIDGMKGKFANVSSNIVGITVSPRRDYILFSHLGGFGLYTIKTSFFDSLLRHLNDEYVTELDEYITRVGYKIGHSRGIVSGHSSIFYGGTGLGSIFRWEISDLLSYPHYSDRMINSVPQTLVASDNRMKWIDTLTLDNNGILWATSSNLIRYFRDVMDYHNTFNYFIWKIPVNDTSYLKLKTSALPTLTTELPEVITVTNKTNNHDTSTAAIWCFNGISLSIKLALSSLVIIRS